MSGGRRPDIVVAVDFGTTYTGVGWVFPQANNAIQTPIQIIKNWPGCASKNEQKVPTCLVYNSDRSLSSWGFLCEDDEGPGKHKEEFFKVFLDINKAENIYSLETPDAIPVSRLGSYSEKEAQHFATDYLKQIYNHVRRTVEEQTATIWADQTIEYIFSVPTTWTNQATINAFKQVIANAGFGKESTSHTATVELTESEAAAVGTIKSGAIRFQKNDIFLSIDAGGGTTDLALMKVVENSEPFPALKQITQVDGIGIGSTFIDKDFFQLASSRTSPFLDQLPPDCVKRLVQNGRFQISKHRFGERAYALPESRLVIDGAGRHVNIPEARIEAGKFILTRAEMQTLFHPHVDSIVQMIHKQLDWAQRNGYGQHVKYMILSGGLGSSPYVRDNVLSLAEKVRQQEDAPQIEVLHATDPQLVVVKGLLLDRLQGLENGFAPVLVDRKARASYGMVCKMKYNPFIHEDGEVLVNDPLDGETYAMQQIDWIIRKGDNINANKPILHPFKRKITPGSGDRKFDSIVVISHLERDKLPSSVIQPGSIQLCTVKADLTSVQDKELELQKLSKGRFSRSKKYYMLNFDVKVIVAPADLRFELWFGGKKLSRGHDSIEVAWDEKGVLAC